MVMTAQQCECTYCRWTVHLKMVKTVKFMLCIFTTFFLILTKKRIVSTIY